MRTSIVYGEFHTLRACLPGESPDCKARTEPRFVEAHDEKFQYLGDPREHVEHVSDKIHIGTFTFGVDALHNGQVKTRKRSPNTIGAWVIHESYVVQLDELDNKIAALQEVRRALTIEAAARGRLLRLEDLEK